MAHVEMDCGPKCRSRQHALELINAITKGSLLEIQAFMRCCHNPITISDHLGRTVLHVAASCGKWQVVEWLLSERHADITTKDLESGWTALHRALFYGQLSAARLLIGHGASLQVRDKEGLSPLDIVMKDRLPHVEFLSSGLQEVYTWGDNSNFTLGHDKEQRMRNPDVVETFRKNKICIKQVVMRKYHSVFLSDAGQVYTCGHGQGGRLGHGNEQTCLVPKLVEGVLHETCVQIDAGRDHTVMLMESGAVYSCGHNDTHQLGQFPPPTSSLVPKQMNGKVLKLQKLLGVCACRFHTVLYTAGAIFTCGLNAGQLGHMKVAGEKLVSQPRKVSALNHEGFDAKLVAASDAATVVATHKGDIYVLHEFQCRKIVSKWLRLEQIAVSGGHLDHNSDLDTLREKGGTELTILLLNSSGRIHVWRAQDPVVRRCAWSIKRPLFVTRMALGISNIAFVTKEGEGFVSHIPAKKQPVSKDGQLSPVSPRDQPTFSPPSGGFIQTLSSRQMECDEIEDMKVERLPATHRASDITMDRKGRNFCVLQVMPNAGLTEVPTIQDTNIGMQFKTLLEEADASDLIHDVVLKVGNTSVAAHRYILACRSEYFRKIFVDKPDNFQSWERPEVLIENVNKMLFMEMLQFIYTDTCQLLKAGSKFKLQDDGQNQKGKDRQEEEMEEFIAVQNGKKISAFEVVQKKKKKGGGQKVDNSAESEKQASSQTKNPVKLLMDLARRFGVKNLSKRLEAVKYVDGKIMNANKKNVPAPRLSFSRNKYPALYDVCIRADDGTRIQCHKCILVARLEYFHSMLGSGWIETSNTESLNLPVPGDILEVVLHYLYADKSDLFSECDDVEFLCNVLVVADQLLIGRLKDMCEIAVASLISLRSACELLEFASVYNAGQLKATCQQFIIINLAALMETRSLDILSEEVLLELTVYYRDKVSSMSCRMITPYSDWPSHSYLETLAAGYQTDKGVSAATGREDQGGKKSGKSKRKRNRTKSSSEDTGDSKKSGDAGQAARVRTVSGSSDTQFAMELDEVNEETGSLPSPRDQDEQDLDPKNSTFPLTICVPRRDKWNPWGKPSPVSPVEAWAGGDTVPELSSPVSPSSPTVPGMGISSSAVGLRAIMEEEMSLAPQTPVPKTASIPQSNNKRSGGKTAQKEKKRKQHVGNQAESAATNKEVSATKIEVSATNKEVVATKPVTPASPWGAVSRVVQSFKTLMLDEEMETSTELVGATAVSPGLPRPPSKAPGADSFRWGLPTSHSQKPRDQQQQQQQQQQLASSPQSPRSPASMDNPWQQKAAAVTSKQDTTVSFTDIIQDEMQQTETLYRATNKPLALIQLEEQAMHELLVHYKADQFTDRHITVQRVPTTLASPTWAAMHRQ